MHGLSVVVLVGDLEESRGWVSEIVEQAKGLKVGNGFAEGVDVGECVFSWLWNQFLLSFISQMALQQGH